MKYDIQTLRLFLAVAREGSIARAAAKEHTVASAVSKRISDLESKIGTPLLYRHRRGVHLTLAGNELQSHAAHIMAGLARLDGALSNYSNGIKGQIRLVANTSAIVQFLPQDLADFLASHPTVKIDLEEHTSEATHTMLLEGSADLGIMVPQRPLEDLHAYLYRADQLMVIMRPDHPLAKRRSLRFSETLEYDYVGLPRGTSLCNTMVAAAEELGLSLRLRIQATSFDGLRRMAAMGLGIGILPRGSVEPFLQTEGLRALTLDESWARRELMLVSKAPDILPKLPRMLHGHLRHIDSAS